MITNCADNDNKITKIRRVNCVVVDSDDTD